MNIFHIRKDEEAWNIGYCGVRHNTPKRKFNIIILGSNSFGDILKLASKTNDNFRICRICKKYYDELRQEIAITV